MNREEVPHPVRRQPVRNPVFLSPAMLVADTTVLELSTSQVRRPMVHNSAGAIVKHRTVFFLGLFVLQDEVAVVIRSANKTKRQDPLCSPMISIHWPF